MKVSPLFNESAAQDGANLVVEFDHTDLTMVTDATAQTLTPFTIAAGETVECIRGELLVPFENTAEAGNNTTAITVGKSGDTAGLMASQELNRNGTEVYSKIGTGTAYAPTASTPILITVAAAAAATNHDELNAGSARLYFRHTRPRQL